MIAVSEDSVRLFTPGSASRGIPHREWKISLSATCLAGHAFYCLKGYALYPGADVIAFFEPRVYVCALPNRQCNDFWVEIQLRTLSDGGHHPAARCPTIYHSRKAIEVNGFGLASITITSSRLAMLVDTSHSPSLVVWDWRSSDVLFVCQFFDHDSTNDTQTPCRSSTLSVGFLWSSLTIAGYWVALNPPRRHHRPLC